MRVRNHGSRISYSICIISGILGVGLCCFFGFGEVSSPSAYNYGYVLLGALMVLLVAFGYRGIETHRRLSNEVWWQLLIAGLIWALFLTMSVLFIFTFIAVLSGGQATVF